jgi:hypothetical protein
VFGLVLLPTLAFVGVTTFERALPNRVEDAKLAARINRIRQYYFDARATGRPVPAAAQ